MFEQEETASGNPVSSDLAAEAQMLYGVDHALTIVLRVTGPARSDGRAEVRALRRQHGEKRVVFLNMLPCTIAIGLLVEVINNSKIEG